MAAFLIPWWAWALGAGGLVLAARKASAKGSASASSGSSSPATFVAPQFRGVPFAEGSARPAWPIHYSSKESRRFEVPYLDVQGKWHGNVSRAFKASRDERYHVGIDIYADGEDLVVSPEDGTIVARLPFYEGTGAMMIELDSGVNVLLGEVKMGGAAEFGLDVGSRVKRGQPVTRVWWHDTNPTQPGIQGGAHMLHFEMYRRGTTTNARWYKGNEPPQSLLDPTAYLLRASAAATAVS